MAWSKGRLAIWAGVGNVMGFTSRNGSFPVEGGTRSERMELKTKKNLNISSRRKGVRSTSEYLTSPFVPGDAVVVKFWHELQ